MEWSPGGWDLYAASFDVQSIRALSERPTPIATRGALSKSKSHRVLPMRAPRRERQARMTRTCRAWSRCSAVGRSGDRKIGRASCRERGESTAVVGGVENEG